MALLTRRSNSRQAQATGIIAPMVRVATHLGYCAALAGREYPEDADWTQAWEDIKEDLAEALAHMANPPDMSPFVPAEVIDQFEAVKTDIETLRDATLTQQEVFDNLQILNHNVAYTAARYEHFAAGIDSTEGTQA